MNSDWLTHSLKPITLNALNAKAELLERVDKKYVLHASVLLDMIDDLAARFDVLEIDSLRDFAYETCYFDDVDRSSYFDHHQGRRQRMKVRVRKYLDSGQCFVEVKLKGKRGITMKKRMPYPVEKFGTLDVSATKHLQKHYKMLYGQPFDHPLEPVLLMRYHRTTLVAREGSERMTIDSNIQFCSGSDESWLDDNAFIVETKSANGNGLADIILKHHHQRPANSCSKYCIGMSVTGIVQHYNRFRPVLRQLGVLP